MAWHQLCATFHMMGSPPYVHLTHPLTWACAPECDEPDFPLFTSNSSGPNMSPNATMIPKTKREKELPYTWCKVINDAQ
jgi:hypothetical protein